MKYSPVFDRTVYAQWESNGAKSFEERLQEETLKQLEHRPEPLSADTLKALDEMQSSWK